MRTRREVRNLTWHWVESNRNLVQCSSLRLHGGHGVLWNPQQWCYQILWFWSPVASGPTFPVTGIQVTPVV